MVQTMRAKVGDWVIYRKQKTSTSPGPRAEAVLPASKGETYSYFVEKYWIVKEVLEDGRIVLRTRRGKEHVVEPGDQNLRHARFWERWLLGARFRAVENSDGDGGSHGRN